MKYILNILQDIYPEKKNLNKHKVLSLFTSHPTYLVFNEQDSIPEFVIHTSPNAKTKILFNNCKELYKVLGNIIAEPLHIVETSNEYFLIEKGLGGVPWFQLSEKLQHNTDWENIKQSATSSLRVLQKAVKETSFGTRKIHLGKSLKSNFNDFLKFNTLPIKDIDKTTEIYSKKLDEYGVITGYAQHGDYCINNLLFDKNKTYIIDFEDIGNNYIPLHDEFTLAISFIFHNQNKKLNIKREIECCISNSDWSQYFDRSSMVII